MLKKEEYNKQIIDFIDQESTFLSEKIKRTPSSLHEQLIKTELSSILNGFLEILGKLKDE